VEVAGGKVHFLTSGTGEPVLILHRDVGNPGWLPFYEHLAQHFTVYVPSHPGFDQSDRPDWMRKVRDMAMVYQWLLKDMKLNSLSVVGLGFGGWIAAEMASMDHHQLKKLVLVSAMGMQTSEEVRSWISFYSIQLITFAGFQIPARWTNYTGKNQRSIN
jgi:pimeloyl-ACP methyl ester carboxylesterase